MLIIHDDAEASTIVREAVQALSEVTKHVGKADRGFAPEQIDEIENEIKRLQNMLNMKRVTGAHRA